MSENVSATFLDRHVGPRADDVARMLEAVGYDSLDALMAAAVPGRIRAGDDWAAGTSLPEAADERTVAAELRALAAL